ncbi:MAG: hypothetical protein V1810_02635 [Candidatus Beckwithbacteria bacterium]
MLMLERPKSQDPLKQHRELYRAFLACIAAKKRINTANNVDLSMFNQFIEAHYRQQELQKLYSDSHHFSSLFDQSEYDRWQAIFRDPAKQKQIAIESKKEQQKQLRKSISYAEIHSAKKAVRNWKNIAKLIGKDIAETNGANLFRLPSTDKLDQFLERYPNLQADEKLKQLRENAMTAHLALVEADEPTLDHFNNFLQANIASELYLGDLVEPADKPNFGYVEAAKDPNMQLQIALNFTRVFKETLAQGLPIEFRPQHQKAASNWGKIAGLIKANILQGDSL